MSDRNQQSQTEDLIDFFFTLLTAHKESKAESVKKLIEKLLSEAAADLPTEFPYLWSEKAGKKFEEMGLAGKLSDYNWKDQKKKKGGLNDPSRKVFHYEHIFTRGEFKKAMIKLTEKDFSREDIRKIVNKHRVAWILKDEDRELTKLGYKSYRENPAEAYKQAGIKLNMPQEELESIYAVKARI